MESWSGVHYSIHSSFLSYGNNDIHDGDVVDEVNGKWQNLYAQQGKVSQAKPSQARQSTTLDLYSSSYSYSIA